MEKPPIFAPPMLKHGNVTINQVSHTLLYLASKLGLCPSEGVALYHPNAIVATILDGLVNKLHKTYHPIPVTDTYEDQKPDAEKPANAIIQTRFPKFFTFFQRLLDGTRGTKFAFPTTVEALEKSGEYDGGFRLYDAVKERLNIKDCLASDGRQSYSNGLWGLSRA